MKKQTLRNIILGSILGLTVLGAGGYGGYVVSEKAFEQGYMKGAYDMQMYWAEHDPISHDRLYRNFGYPKSNELTFNVLKEMTPLERVTSGLGDARD